MVFGGGLRSALQQSGGGCTFYGGWMILDRTFVYVKPVYVEQFIPSRSTLMEYFISKV